MKLEKFVLLQSTPSLEKATVFTKGFISSDGKIENDTILYPIIGGCQNLAAYMIKIKDIEEFVAINFWIRF